MSQLKWGVLLSYLSMGLNVVISLIYMPFMLRILGQSEWGLYQLVASVVGYLSLLSFGFGGAYIRFYARAVASESKDQVAKLNGLFLVVFSVIGLIAVAVGVLLMANTRAVLGPKLTAQEIATARILIGLMTATVAISFPASVFSSFVIANERFVFQRALDLIRVVSTPVLMVLVLLNGFKSVGMAAAATAVAVVFALINVAYCVGRIEMRFSLKGFDLLLLREVAVFSSFIFIGMVVDQVNWGVDKFILGRFGGTAAVAVYAVAALLNTYYISVSTTVTSVFVPRVNRIVAISNDNTELTHLFTRVGRIQFLILMLVCTGLIVFGLPFITMWAPPGYAGAYPIMLILVISVTIDLIQNLGIEIQRAKNMHQFRSWLLLGIAAGNIALSIPLAKQFGGVGAAAGTAASLLLGSGLIMNWYYAKRVGLDIGYFWKNIAAFVPALIPVAVVGAAIMRFAHIKSAVQLVAWGVVYVVVYAVSMWFFGMNDSERDIIGRPVARGFGRLKSALR